jgi:hypothetical protein
VKLAIQKAKPQDGNYLGTLSGYNLKFKAPSAEDGKFYNFTFVQAIGVRGNSTEVNVSVLNSKPTFTLKKE